MAKKLTPGQVAKELNDIAAGVERAARAVDPYSILGLSHSASLEEVKMRYRQLSNIYHPDKEGGYEGAMKLLNNAYEQIQKEIIKRG